MLGAEGIELCLIVRRGLHLGKFPHSHSGIAGGWEGEMDANGFKLATCRGGGTSCI